MEMIKKFILKINGYLNKHQRERKVFCIGLHKTGTTTLAMLFKDYGFNTIHSVDWQSDENKLSKYDFFSDGGSHFDDVNEFNIKRLQEKFPEAFFILQTRDTEKWIISKLKHAGWKEDTIPIDFNKSEINHEDWKFKSLFIVQKLIEHKYDYEKKVKKYFSKKPNNFLVIDITDEERQYKEYNKLKQILNLRSINKIDLPHSNKRKSNHILSKDVLDFIKTVN